VLSGRSHFFRAVLIFSHQVFWVALMGHSLGMALRHFEIIPAPALVALVPAVQG